MRNGTVSSLHANSLEAVIKQPEGGEYALLQQLALDVLGAVMESQVPLGWVSADGMPLLVPMTNEAISIFAPGESINHAVTVPPLIAGLLLSVFALEYGVFADSGRARRGLSREILQLKYRYIAMLRAWCSSDPQGDLVMELIE